MTTKLSPCSVMFGQQPILPIDIDFKAAANASAIDSTATAYKYDLLQEILDKQRLAHNAVHRRV